MRLTDAAAIPSWKVKFKFKDTITKFRGKYESDKLNHSGSEWTEVETTLVEICAEIDEKAVAKGNLTVAETLKEQQKKDTEIGFNLCNADPAAFAYDDDDSLRHKLETWAQKMISIDCQICCEISGRCTLQTN